MKFSKGREPGDRLVKAKELLVGERPEKIDFQVDRDLSPVQIQAIFEDLDRFIVQEDWERYVPQFISIQALWPDMKGRVIPNLSKDKVRERLEALIRGNRLEFAVMRLAQLKVLGLDGGVTLPKEEEEKFLLNFDRTTSTRDADSNFTSKALEIIRLGLRPTEEVFRDPQQAAEKVQYTIRTLLEFKDDLQLAASVMAEAKILFPEMVKVSPELLREMKQDLAKTSSSATIKTLRFAHHLKLLVSDEVILGSNGEILSRNRSKLEKSKRMPERDLA